MPKAEDMMCLSIDALLGVLKGKGRDETKEEKRGW
jgi:hypothetical protein